MRTNVYQNQDYYKEPHMTNIMKYRKKRVIIFNYPEELTQKSELN